MWLSKSYSICTCFPFSCVSSLRLKLGKNPVQLPPHGSSSRMTKISIKPSCGRIFFLLPLLAATDRERKRKETSKPSSDSSSSSSPNHKPSVMGEGGGGGGIIAAIKMTIEREEEEEKEKGDHFESPPPNPFFLCFLQMVPPLGGRKSPTIEV